jgi:CheY-like chemotaxis protein
VIRVLAVDDEAPIRLLCRVNLEAEGMEVIEAADGRASVQLAKCEQPDMILLGVMMPRLDGSQAAEEVAKEQETRARSRSSSSRRAPRSGTVPAGWIPNDREHADERGAVVVTGPRVAFARLVSCRRRP